MKILGFTQVEDSPDHRNPNVTLWAGHGLEIEISTSHQPLNTNPADIMSAILAQARCDAVAGHQQHLRRALGFDLAGHGFVSRVQNPASAVKTPAAHQSAPNPLQSLAIHNGGNSHDSHSDTGSRAGSEF